MPKSKSDPVTAAVADPWPDILTQARAQPLDTLDADEKTVEMLRAENQGMSAKTAGDALLAAEKLGLVTSRRVKLVQGRGKVKAYKPVKHAQV